MRHGRHRGGRHRGGRGWVHQQELGRGGGGLLGDGRSERVVEEEQTLRLRRRRLRRRTHGRRRQRRRDGATWRRRRWRVGRRADELADGDARRVGGGGRVGRVEQRVRRSLQRLVLLQHRRHALGVEAHRDEIRHHLIQLRPATATTAATAAASAAAAAAAAATADAPPTHGLLASAPVPARCAVLRRVVVRHMLLVDLPLPPLLVAAVQRAREAAHVTVAAWRHLRVAARLLLGDLGLQPLLCQHLLRGTRHLGPPILDGAPDVRLAHRFAQVADLPAHLVQRVVLTSFPLEIVLDIPCDLRHRGHRITKLLAPRGAERLVVAVALIHGPAVVKIVLIILLPITAARHLSASAR